MAPSFGPMKLGFGCMRFPMKEGEVDHAELCRMVDAFLSAGLLYFDTAHGYLRGKSEGALKAALTSRYPRDRYLLADKLSTYFFEREEEIRPHFEEQLRATGVDYFDFYLMHSQNRALYPKYRRCRAYEIAAELQREGKIRHLGLSFHDTPELLEEILSAHPEIEVVQLQLNYADYEDPTVESRRCLAVARRFGKPVIAMEPIKGGSLANLPPKEREILDRLGGGTPASYALRFAADEEGVVMVLSGMGSLAMMEENIATMCPHRPLTEDERLAILRVRESLAARHTIPCTACEYCTPVCPQGIPIPKLFAAMNAKEIFGGWNPGYYYDVHTEGGGRAGSCIGCGACEGVCPQRLPIRRHLAAVAKEFEKD